MTNFRSNMDRFQPPTSKEQQDGGLETRECKNCQEKFVPKHDSDRLCNHCETYSPCCDVLIDNDVRICPKCKEHC